MIDYKDPKQVLEICEAATPGPWEVNTEYMTEPGYEKFIKRQAVTTSGELVEEDEEDPYIAKYTIARMDWSNPVAANAALIAFSREALPYWLSEAERLQNEIDPYWMLEAERLRAENEKFKAIADIAKKICKAPPPQNTKWKPIPDEYIQAIKDALAGMEG